MSQYGSGGTIRDISIDSRIFILTAEADFEIQNQKFVSESKPNSNGTYHTEDTVTNPSVSGVDIVIDDDNGDYEALVTLASKKEGLPINFALRNGDVFFGTGNIIGEVKRKTKSPVCSISLIFSELDVVKSK